MLIRLRDGNKNRKDNFESLRLKLKQSYSEVYYSD